MSKLKKLKRYMLSQECNFEETAQYVVWRKILDKIEELENE